MSATNIICDDRKSLAATKDRIDQKHSYMFELFIMRRGNLLWEEEMKF